MRRIIGGRLRYPKFRLKNGPGLIIEATISDQFLSYTVNNN